MGVRGDEDRANSRAVQATATAAGCVQAETVDIGPGAGQLGGQLDGWAVVAGPPSTLAADPASRTAPQLRSALA